MAFSASSISRMLHEEFGIITLPDRRREGYRVTGSKTTGTVTIHVMFDHEKSCERKTRNLAKALLNYGYQVSVNAVDGLITLTGKVSI